MDTKKCATVILQRLANSLYERNNRETGVLFTSIEFETVEQCLKEFMEERADTRRTERVSLKQTE